MGSLRPILKIDCSALFQIISMVRHIYSYKLMIYKHYQWQMRKSICLFLPLNWTMPDHWHQITLVFLFQWAINWISNQFMNRIEMPQLRVNKYHISKCIAAQQTDAHLSIGSFNSSGFYFINSCWCCFCSFKYEHQSAFKCY